MWKSNKLWTFLVSCALLKMLFTFSFVNFKYRNLFIIFYIQIRLHLTKKNIYQITDHITSKQVPNSNIILKKQYSTTLPTSTDNPWPTVCTTSLVVAPTQRYYSCTEQVEDPHKPNVFLIQRGTKTVTLTTLWFSMESGSNNQFLPILVKSKNRST